VSLRRACAGPPQNVGCSRLLFMRLLQLVKCRRRRAAALRQQAAAHSAGPGHVHNSRAPSMHPRRRRRCCDGGCLALLLAVAGPAA
jgi:hypothetical protein